jgi:hypothetical protein
MGSKLVWSKSGASVFGNSFFFSRDAMFVFVFLLDIGRASLLAQYSLLAKSFPEVRKQIGKGMGILGPEVTLDTLVEVLVIGVGTLSGVRKLELLCYFACLSVLVRYFVFLTFFPALLSLFLEVRYCHVFHSLFFFLKFVHSKYNSQYFEKSLFCFAVIPVPRETHERAVLELEEAFFGRRFKVKCRC